MKVAKDADPAACDFGSPLIHLQITFPCLAWEKGDSAPFHLCFIFISPFFHLEGGIKVIRR